MQQLVNYNGQLINLNGGVLANKFPIRDGLVFYLDPGVDKCYPDTGTTATDLSPSGITTYVQNGVTFNSDNKGYFEFDGANDYLNTTGDALDLTHTDKYTLNLWFRLDDYNSSVKLMVEHSTIANNNPGAWFIDHSEYGVDGSLQFNAVGTGGWNISWTDDPYDDNIWHLYSVTYDASLSALDCVTHYLDGEVVAHTHHPTSNLRLDLNNFGIKKDLYFNSRAGAQFFSNHDLGIFQIYDRILSQDEIRSIYNHHKQRFEHIITDGLVLNLDAQSKFSYPGTGTTWSDLAPSGNDATLVNGPTYQSEPAAIVFDGVNDYATTYDDNNVFQDNDPWTMIAAYKIDDLSATGSMGIIGSQRYFVESDPGGWGVVIQRIGEGANQTYFRIFLTADDGVTQVSTQRLYQTQLECQRWYILAASYNPDTSSLAYYIDGQNLNVTGTAATANDGWTVNKTNRNGLIHMASQGGWNGIDWGASFGEVQVYKRTLTDDEIAYNFEARRGRYGI